MLEHRYEQALALAERSVSIHEAHGSGHGLAVALATLGQICVRLGDLTRAEEALHRALDVRSPIQFHETTGAVFDTLAQIHLIRGRYDAGQRVPRAAPAMRTARTAGRPVSGTNGRCACCARGWRSRAARSTKRFALADDIVPPGAPPFDALQATLIAAEALTAAGQLDRAERSDSRRWPIRSIRASRRRPGPSICGCAARSASRAGALADAYHDFAQSATLLDLLGERYQTALSHLAIGRLVARSGARIGRRAPPRPRRRGLHPTRRRARSRRHRGGARPAHQRSAPAKTSSRRPMPTMRWCGGSWMRRRCPICSGARPRRALLRGVGGRRGDRVRGAVRTATCGWSPAPAATPKPRGRWRARTRTRRACGSERVVRRIARPPRRRRSRRTRRRRRGRSAIRRSVACG